MNRPLTNQQRTVYEFILERIVTRGYGPTVREIGEHMNIRSPNGVMCHLRALERKGMITRAANKSRAIELTESIASLVGASLPINGRVSGGKCGVTAEASEVVDLAKLTAHGRCFLRVSDDSLMDAQIRSGDLLVMQRQTHADAGQLAIVRTGDAETYLRYWFPEGGRIRLQPVSRAIPAAVVDHAEVLGIIAGVVRLLEAPSLP